MSDYSEIMEAFDAHCRSQGIRTYLELVQVAKDAEAKGFNRGYHLVKVLLDKAEEDMNT